MKKIVLIVFFAITIVSCKKEAGVSPSVNGNASYDSQVAALIQKADKDLYNQLYNPSPNQKFPIISIKSLPGIFYIPVGGIDNATCWPSYNVCMVIVSASKMSDPGQPQTITSTITESYSEIFPKETTAKVILNSTPVESKIITSFSAQKGQDGIFYVNYN